MVPSRPRIIIPAGILLLYILTGCTTAPMTAVPSSVPNPSATVPMQTDLPQTEEVPASPTVQPQREETLVAVPTSLPTSLPLAWQDWPVVPETISDTTREIYLRGLAMGNNPQAFSKVGDCEIYTTWFLYDYDQGPAHYDLGPYANLQPVLEHFAGSYGRMSLATQPGFTAASLMTPLWANRDQCNNDESPLACELRIHRPAFAIVALGTNDASNPPRFEENFRKVIETCMEHGVVPILSTKADNLEGDGSINATIVRLAQEYDVPLWNFWAALQELPRQGLQEDGVHLTWYPNDFSDPRSLESASWPRRNLSALQVLEVVWQGVED